MKKVLSKACAFVLLFFSGSLLADSQDAQEKETSTARITFIDKISIVADKNNQLLGASSIRYDAANERFLILSDDTGAYPNVFGEVGEARYYTFPLSDIWSVEKQGLADDFSSRQLSLEMHKFLSGKQTVADEPVITTSEFQNTYSRTSTATIPVNAPPELKLKDLEKGGVDIESITTFNDDELLIVSENGVWEWNTYSSLLKVDRESRVTGYYHFPDRFTDDQPWYRTAWHYPKQYDDIYGKGIKRNKGIESLDRIKGTNEYIAIVEAPLIQDAREWDRSKGVVPSRLLHFSMDEFTESENETGVVKLIGEYFYPFEPLPDELTRNALESYPRRSISDVEVINQQYALVLEKSYIRYNYIDKRRPKSVTDIYLVRLKSAFNFVGAEEDFPQIINRKKHKTLEKTLLMRSTAMEDQVPEFTRLNIEGVTLGPEFADGSGLLALINDNDAYNAKVTSSWSMPQSKLRELMFSKSSVVPAYFWAEGGLFSSPLFRDKEPTHLLFFRIPAVLLGEAAFSSVK